MSLTGHADTPTLIAFDLDPGEGADLLTCCEVALLLKDVFDRLKMESFAKVSGSKGIQIYVPLNTPVAYAVTQPFAKTVAELLEQQHLKLIVSKMAKVLRKSKVFIDWSQNADHKTTGGVYSSRAKSTRPYVPMPIAWHELDRALRKRDLDALLTISEMARACGVSINTISHWRQKGLVRAHAVNDRAQFLFEHPGPNPPKKHSREVANRAA